MERRDYIPCSRNYGEVLEEQRAEFRRRIDCRKNGEPLPDDLLIMVEHRPVVTLGRHGKTANLLLSPAALAETDTEYHETDRGGDITYHGPGQLTVYPIMDLERRKLGVKDYVALLESAVISVLESYGIKGERIEGKTGVWVGKNTAHERKICAIGIRCSRHVTMHGFALNVGGDLSGFDAINPCGLGKAVTSISKETGRETGVAEVADRVWEYFNGTGK